MIELPEAVCLAKQFNQAVAGKRVERVLPPTKPHSFCWFNGDAVEYHAKLAGRVLEGAEGFGMFVELAFDGGQRLCIDDGVNPRFVQAGKLPKDFQLAAVFCDGTALAFTVAMYGGIYLHEGGYQNEYYVKSRQAVSPLCADFDGRFYAALSSAKQTLSMKAFLATQQRFPGIGNGVAQDILFNAGLHPKRKIATLSEEGAAALLKSVKSTLKEMTELGGRDTEKDIFANPGGYATKMSKNTVSRGCPACGGAITKEAYLGGSVYYCPRCQPLDA